ncbi:MAG: peptide transporter substrate-binding protein [Rhodocyclales bacterium]|nr:peptide transporter substrate-binding protein [Rhodocyclales bacterium]
MLRHVLAGLLAIALIACSRDGSDANNPYPASDSSRRIVYDFFSERPKHLDPVQSYVENEADILYQIYEPLYDYDFLKRPYALKPQLATAMPKVRYLDARGRKLPDRAPAGRVARTVYEIHIREGVRFQPHPAFARDDKGGDGHYLYHALTPGDIAGKYMPSDFAQSATRELTAEDFAYQIKRLARPGLQSPVFETLKLIDGLEELQAQLATDVKQGKISPAGWIDLRKYPLRGVETPDAHTLRITLHGKYPQFVYWLTQTFVVPVPWEADRFFSQPGMKQNNLTLDVWPVGTGPFMQAKHDANREIRLVRNPNWRGETYPCEGSDADRAAGLLKDCGQALPLIDAISLQKESEAIPFWNKFLQGYYDQFNSARMSLASFDSAVSMPERGGLDITDDMQKRGIRLQTEVEPGVRYYAFNMLDPVLGGGENAASQEHARKLRQAISIAIDIEEQLAVFYNGLGMPAQGPIPPGIAGYRDGCAGRNTVVYDCVNGKVQRKDIAVARKLLAEAGYPDGRDAKSGEPLILYFDGVGSAGGRIDWLAQQFKKLGIQLVPRLTDFNRFQDKTRSGNFQILFWGWGADYPDPENFLFLFYGKHARSKYDGENTANYINPEYDRLYVQLKAMDIDDPARTALIDRMVAMLRYDAPWVFGWHDEAFFLRHAWLQNTKPGRIIRSSRKYQRVDTALREQQRHAWNRPVLWPAAVLIALLLLGGWQMRRMVRRREARRALPVVDTKALPGESS